MKKKIEYRFETAKNVVIEWKKKCREVKIEIRWKRKRKKIKKRISEFIILWIASLFFNILINQVQNHDFFDFDLQFRFLISDLCEVQIERLSFIKTKEEKLHTFYVFDRIIIDSFIFLCWSSILYDHNNTHSNLLFIISSLNISFV